MKIFAAYGSTKDISVYTSLGLPPSQIYIVGRPTKKLQYQCQVSLRTVFPLYFFLTSFSALSLSRHSLSTVHRRWIRDSSFPAGVQSEIETRQDRQRSHGPPERQFRAGRQWRLLAEAQSPSAHHLFTTHVLHTTRTGRPSRTCSEPIRM